MADLRGQHVDRDILYHCVMLVAMDRLLYRRLENVCHCHISATHSCRFYAFCCSWICEVIIELIFRIFWIFSLWSLALTLGGSFLKVASIKRWLFSRSLKKLTVERCRHKFIRISRTVVHACKKRKRRMQITHFSISSKRHACEELRFCWLSFGWRFRWCLMDMWGMSARSVSTFSSHSQLLARQNFQPTRCWHSRWVC